MKKVFIGSAPLQPPKPTCYHAVDNQKLSYDGIVINPLCVLLRGYAAPGDDVTIIVCVTEGTIAEENFSILKEEFLKIGQEIGFSPNVVSCPIENDEGIHVHIKLLTDLVDLCGEDQLFYMDLTFGTKPTPIVLINFLRYICIAKGGDVVCICYGRMEHMKPDHPSYIHDITALYTMTKAIDPIAGVAPKDFKETLTRAITGKG